MAKPDQPDTIRVRGLENQLYLMGSQLEWIEAILDGKEVSDFAMSFPIVRRVWELRQITEVEEMNGIGTVKFEPKCRWTEDDEGIWYTECGNAHEFMTDSPTENKYKFCPYCGREIKHADNI